MTFYLDLASLTAAVLLFGLVLYLLQDGILLGVALASALMPDAGSRAAALASTERFRLAGESWLLFVTVLLYAGFPRGWAVLTAGLHLPLLGLLLALVIRGGALRADARAAPGAGARRWRRILVASLLISLFEGIIAGALIAGLPVVDGQFAGGAWDWFGRFPVICGLAMLTLHALLGCAWLCLSDDPETAGRARDLLRRLPVAMVLLSLSLTAWLAISDPALRATWLAWPGAFWPAVLLLLLAGLAWLLVRAAARGDRRLPLLLAAAMALVCVAGPVTAFGHWIVPRGLDLHDAAAAPASAAVVLAGALVLLPLAMYRSGRITGEAMNAGAAGATGAADATGANGD